MGVFADVYHCRFGRNSVSNFTDRFNSSWFAGIVTV